MAQSVQKTETTTTTTGELAAGEQAGMSAVLRNRNFLFLWLAQVISQLAQQMINFALIIQVSDLSQSGTANAGVIISFTVPGILFSAIAGVVVDRQSKRKVLVITNAARGIVVLFYAVLAVGPQWVGGFILPLLYLNTLVFSSISQFFVPAEGTMIPQLVKRNELIAANSLFNLTFTVAQLMGFAFLGPILTQLIGYKWLYIALCVCYVICSILTWTLPEKGVARATQPGAAANQKENGPVEDLKEGWAFIRRDTGLMNAIIYSSIATAVFMMLGTIGPLFIKQVLQIPSDQLTFVIAPGGLGLVTGVLLVGRLAKESNRTRMIRGGMLVGAILLMVLALAHGTIGLVAQWVHQPAPPIGWSQVIIGVLAFLLGASNSFITVPSQTVLQERSPEHIRARVFSAFNTVSNTLLILPLVAAGAMADLFGVVQTVVVIGVLLLAVVIVSYRLDAKTTLPPPVPQQDGDEAGLALVAGAAPMPLDDERQHALNLPDTPSPNGAAPK